MSDAFRFETFVDVHDNVFNEYLGSVMQNCPEKTRNTVP